MQSEAINPDDTFGHAGKKKKKKKNKYSEIPYAKIFHS